MDKETPTTNSPNPKENDMTTSKLTVANMTFEITRRGYDADVAGRTFVKAVGQRMDDMTAEERGSKMADAFSQALEWHEFLPGSLLDDIDQDAALGFAAVAILEESDVIKRA